VPRPPKPGIHFGNLRIQKYREPIRPTAAETARMTGALSSARTSSAGTWAHNGSDHNSGHMVPPFPCLSLNEDFLNLRKLLYQKTAPMSSLFTAIFPLTSFLIVFSHPFFCYTDTYSRGCVDQELPFAPGWRL
jgi:hypothetical protein